MNTLNFISSNPDIATPVDPRQPGYFTSIRSDSRAGSHPEFLAADKFGPVPLPHLTAGDVTHKHGVHMAFHMASASSYCRTAVRHDAKFCNGYVFLYRPINSGDKFGESWVIQIIQTESIFFGGMVFDLLVI